MSRIKSILIICVIISLSFINLRVSSQNRLGSIGGIITDSVSREPINKVVVELLSSKDSTLYKATLTDSLGNFRFDNIKQGEYLFRVSALNYSIFFLRISSSDFNQKAINIYLSKQISELKEVIVKSRLPVITFDGDKMIVDPQKIAGVSSSTALDLMKSMPGVIVENESTLSLNGNSDVTILIDDRRRTMTLDQAVRLLRTIPSSNVKQVEISTVKSARYDASGSGGVINIVTKKPLANGYNLQITNQAIFDRYTSYLGNIYYNQRINAFTLFASVGYERGISYSNNSSSAKYSSLNGVKVGTFDFGNSKSASSSPYFDLGIDYEIKRNKILSISSSLYRGSATSNSYLNSTIDQGTKQIIENTNSQRGKDELASFDIIYTQKFDSLGSKLKLDLGYISGFSIPSPNFSISYKNENGLDIRPPVNVLANLPLNGRQFIYQGDFDKVFNKKSTLSAGFKYTKGSIDNNIRYDSLINGSFREDFKRSDNLRYDERVAAMYLTYKHTISKRLNFLVGVRYESTTMKNISFKLDSTNRRVFNNFFPSLSFSYNGSKVKSTLSIARSISRPYYGYLNPYVTYIDEFVTQVGNANLFPGYTYTINLNNSINNFIYISSGLSFAKDMVFLFKRLQPNSLQTVITPENALTYTSVFISGSVPFSLFEEKWEGQVRLYGFAYKTNMNPKFFTSELDRRLLGRYIFSTSNTVRLFKSLYAESSFFYYSKMLNNQSEIKKRIQVDFGLRKKIKNDFMSFSLYATDVFFGMRQNHFRYYNGFEANGFTQYNTQRIRVSLILNLGKLQDDFSKSTSTKKESERFKNK